MCSKFIIKNYKKTAGRKIIEQIKIPENVENIYLCGKESKKQIEYIEKKLKKKITFFPLPLFKNFYETSQFRMKLNNNSLVILNISTPKQEIIANNLLRFNHDKKIFVFWLGGGVAMAAGEEIIVPQKIENLNLEWLWRLRTNTFFRMKSLIYTSSIFFYKKISNYFKKVKIEELN